MATQYTPEPGRHLRGVVEEKFGFEGIVLLRAWTCKGYLVGQMQCPKGHADRWRAIMWAELDAPDCCPEHHGIICPEAAARLRAVVQRNADSLSLVRSPR